MTDKQIQCLLTYLGYNPGPIDGISGAKTKAALEAFRADYGIGAEGLVDAVAGTAARLHPPNDADSTGIWAESPYFTRQEFRCPCGKCGGFPVEPNANLVRLVNAIREEIGKPIVIVPPDGHSGGSGVRCQAYNDSLKGSAKNSYHILGKAADLCIYGVPQSTVEAVLAKHKAEIHYSYKITTGSYHVDVY